MGMVAYFNETIYLRHVVEHDQYYRGWSLGRPQIKPSAFSIVICIWKPILIGLQLLEWSANYNVVFQII